MVNFSNSQLLHVETDLKLSRLMARILVIGVDGIGGVGAKID